MERWLHGQRILTVGDGDFSFSRSLLKLEPSELVATVYDDEATVCHKYQSARSSIDAIRARFECHCGIDAMRLPTELTSRRFDRAIFQFPLVPPATKEVWFAGANVALRNRNLLLGFLRQVEPLLADNGLVMITTKDVQPYLSWRIQWAFSDHTSLQYLGKLPFEPGVFMEYQVQNVERDQKVKCTAAYTYLYGCKAPNDTSLVPPVRMSPSMYCYACAAGPFSGKGDMEKHNQTSKHAQLVAFEEQWTEIATKTQCPGGERRDSERGGEEKKREAAYDEPPKRQKADS